MSAAAIPQGASRGQLVQRWLLGSLLAALVGVMAIGAWTFAWPSDAARGSYALGPASGFEPGTVTSYVINERGELALVESVDGHVNGNSLVYVVRFPDGDFRVFSGVSTHLRHVVVWEAGPPTWRTEYGGEFVAPAHGERWTIDGTRMWGPAPRDLDRYRWQIDDLGVLVIELDELERGASGSPAPAPYDVTSEGWATSGWPSR